MGEAIEVPGAVGMASDHGAAALDDGMDMAAHEATYDHFIELTKTCTIVILNIVLLLVLWTIEAHGFVALIAFILTVAAATVGQLIGQGWKLVAPIFLLIGLACIVL
jgi:Bacterial aa3 type cytochrome c oxidase subunit IV